MSRETSRSSESVSRRSRPARWLWIAAGWCLVAVGAVGVVVPGLPTTGPLLLALACFARGSDRLHAWLLNHPVFGPPLRRWQEHRAITVRGKVVAVTMMLGSLAYVAWKPSLPTWAVFAIGGVILVGIVVVLRLPHATGDDNPDARRTTRSHAERTSDEPASKPPE